MRRPLPIALVAAVTLASCGGPSDEVQSGTTVTGEPADTRQEDAEPDADDALNASSLDAGLTGPDASTSPDVAADTGPAPVEKCINFQDDDDDGLIDEGCYPAPNLRGNQSWLDFGVYEVKPGDATGPKVSVNVATQGHRTTAVARDVSTPNVMVAGDWVTHPDGKHLLGPMSWAAAPARGAGGLGGATLLFGSSNTTPLATGQWIAGFRRTTNLSNAGPGALKAGFLHIGAVVSKPPKATARIDLDVYLVGGAPQPAKSFGTSVLWSRIRARVDAIWKPAGIVIGKTTFTDITGAAGQKYLHVDDVLALDDTNELRGLWALGAKLKPASSAVSLFIVASLNHAGQPAAAGITGQIAGINGLPGHRLGSVALAMSKTTVKKFHDTDPTAQLAGTYFGDRLAHELGHHLGLWHTTERPADLHDTVSDTAECKLKPGHSMVLSEHCPKSGDNLMFWAPKGVALSAGQRTVARRHGSVH